MLSNNEFSEVVTLPSENEFHFPNLFLGNEDESNYNKESLLTSKYLDRIDNNLELFQNENINDFSFFELNRQLNSKNSFEKEEEEDVFKNLYFIQNQENTFKKNKSQLFIVKDDKISSKNGTIELTRKKRGREKKNNDKNSNIHDKFSSDNLLRKVQVHYLTFILSFLNDVLKHLKIKGQFYMLSYAFKKNVKKDNVNLLKNTTIKDIICNKISTKYRNIDKNSNIETYYKIRDNEILNKIFSESYLKFFKKFYYKSNKVINLKDYGLNENIKISDKTKMYRDLLASDKDKEYQKNMNHFVIQTFFPDSIFSFNSYL